MSAKQQLKSIASEMRSEAENISPRRGHCDGQAHPAPELRRWAREINKVASLMDEKRNGAK